MYIKGILAVLILNHRYYDTREGGLKMFLADENIINLLVDYSMDIRYKQAVLIDGDWGSGKTYFIQEKLIPMLNEKIGTDTEHKRSVFYVSLYGMENFSQVIDEIYAVSLETFFDEKLGEGKGEKIGKGINFASKLITAGMKYFNVDTSEFPSISDIKKIKNSVIIFDDLERCSLDTNQLLGFINNLVEHNDIKVIIVANQSEIGKPKLLNDLPLKYSVVLNPKLKLESQKDDKATVEKIQIEDLRKYTEILFSEDILYEKIKEKLIGLTIHYRADLRSIYEEIVRKYANSETAREKLITNIDLVIEIFERRRHCNIRTLIFAIIAFEKLFLTISEIDFKPSKFIEEQYLKVLKYIVETSIQLKTGQKLYSWDNKTSKSGIVYFGKSGILGESIFGYRFVDTYLTTRFYDPEEVKSVITNLINEAYFIEQSQVSENALSYNKLYAWWRLEDEEITDLLNCTLTELSQRKYHPRYFKDLIILLMQLQHAKFNPFDYTKFCDDFIGFMKDRMEDVDDGFNSERLEVLSDSPEFIREYNEIIKPLVDIVNEKERKEKEKINENLDLDRSWGKVFLASCTTNRDSYVRDKKFLFYIRPEKVIDKLRTSNVEDIYSFLDGVKTVYNFSNLNDFFKDDASNIKQILNEMHVDELANGRVTKRIVLEKLYEHLKKSLDLIEK